MRNLIDPIEIISKEFTFLYFSNLASSEGVTVNYIMRNMCGPLLELLGREGVSLNFIYISSDDSMNEFNNNMDKIPFHSFRWDVKTTLVVFKKL